MKMFRTKNYLTNCLLFIWFTQIFFIEFAACDTCWSSDRCEIHATYYDNLKTIEVSRSYKCDSTETESQQPGTDTPTDGLHNFITTKNVSLNGCSAPLNAHTYGVEYLPNCDSLIAVTIERFQTDELLPLNCLKSSNNLKYLKFKQNDVRVVDSKAFEQLVELEQLYFIANTVQYIERGAFDEIRSLKLLSIEEENNYYLNVNTLFWNTTIEHLQLITLKSIHKELFRNLPESLKLLHVENTPIENNDIELENAKELSHISITNCRLQRFILNDSFGSVLFVNLSGNALSHLGFTAHNVPIESLDLSHNHLKVLNNEWLSRLSNLKELLLNNNIFKTLSLDRLLSLSSQSNELLVDLSGNHLASFKDVNAVRSSELYMMRLKIDRNPWNCMWVIEFSYKHPHLFHLFQYDKYISRINVNGLECVADVQLPLNDDELDSSNAKATAATSNTEKDTNHTLGKMAHYVVGGPWEVKRNQRAEALIIVFMLPLGIAFLFLLLYLWIHCHKLFSLSYYQSMSKSHDTNDNANYGTEVKQLTSDTTNDTDGYEVPLNIDLPIYRQALANDDVTDEGLKKNYEVVSDIEKPQNGGIAALQPVYEYLPDY